ncbi:hypothetical protein [Acaryochloris sp. IP29b_bin.148]|uniref:hypothetical protein n=1 Tax=Acaryochloris sp. IP29b_bin.148 TaxID=2969218 RepID=UPI00260EE9A1|nr:hypothetical protein [Acaryochloris sp. IP29b_bin.148]
MPFALNTVMSLAKMGWAVDLYLWEKPLWGRPIADYRDLLPQNVSIQFFTESRFGLTGRYLERWLRSRFKQRKDYHCVLGLGQKGAFIGNVLAKANECPLIQVVDEFPSNWPQTMWTTLEQEAAQKAAMIVVPDPQQYPLISEELGLSQTTPYATLPNIAAIQPCAHDIDWHLRFKLPKDSIPFLYAGTVDTWARVPEILSSVADWPEPAVLIVHSRSKGEVDAFRQRYSHLENHRIYWSDQVLSQDELNSLVAYCEGSFALYHNSGPHIEYVGFSSGKLMRSLACGSPVIASQLSSFSFIEKENLGILIEGGSEIPSAIHTLMGKQSEYRERCLNFCQTKASFEAYWPKFYEQLIQMTGNQLES